jgi:hypothetical protein
MQLTKQTVSTLRSFAAIANYIVIEPGNIISTMSTDKNIVAIAEVEDLFEKQFAVYDLVRFLNIMSLFKSPSINFMDNSKHAKIEEGTTVVDYTFANPSLFTAAPRSIKEIPEITRFELTQQMLDALTSSIKIMGLNRIVLKGDGKHLHLGAIDAEGATSDKYDTIVGETDQEFDVFLNPNHILMIPDTYNVSINNRMLKFTSTTNKLSYWIAMEKNSKFSVA